MRTPGRLAVGVGARGVVSEVTFEGDIAVLVINGLGVDLSLSFHINGGKEEEGEQPVFHSAKIALKRGTRKGLCT